MFGLKSSPFFAFLFLHPYTINNDINKTKSNCSQLWFSTLFIFNSSYHIRIWENTKSVFNLKINILLILTLHCILYSIFNNFGNWWESLEKGTFLIKNMRKSESTYFLDFIAFCSILLKLETTKIYLNQFIKVKKWKHLFYL